MEKLNFYFDNAGQVQVANGQNQLAWPTDGSWWGQIEDCPYQEELADHLRFARRRLEDAIRKNRALLIECLSVAEKHGYH